MNEFLLAPLNYDWARQNDTLQRASAISYFLQSPEHKKRLWAHWYHVETYLTAIYNSRKSAYRLLADLKVHRENLSADDMRKYYDSLGLNALVAYDCDAAPTKVYLSGGEATLITNLSSDTVALKTFDFYDNIPRTYRLGPKQTRFTHTQWIKGDGLTPHYMDLLDGENCQIRYIQKQNGYLVVE